MSRPTICVVCGGPRWSGSVSSGKCQDCYRRNSAGPVIPLPKYESRPVTKASIHRTHESRFSGDELFLPADFKRPRFVDGWELNTRTWWSEDDLLLLRAASDLAIKPSDAANTLGRSATSIVHKGYQQGIRMPRAWMDLVRPPSIRRERRELLSYPYIAKFTDKHADLVAVNKMVAQQLPGREDVCQDIMLALWESRTTLEALRADPEAVKAFTRAFRKASFERGGYGVESMDELTADGQSKYEIARYQRLLVNNDDAYIEEYVLNGNAHRVQRDTVIDDLSRQEESFGVPMAFWREAELSGRVRQDAAA